ncbi:adenosylcobinamide-GDP ribazoletransferase [Saliniramus fredricksonii]|nr:adenosylcobinamide-GDP ribazoletransferase [Saliniramus fredricksonii]
MGHRDGLLDGWFGDGWFGFGSRRRAMRDPVIGTGG